MTSEQSNKYSDLNYHELKHEVQRRNIPQRSKLTKKEDMIRALIDDDKKVDIEKYYQETTERKGKIHLGTLGFPPELGGLVEEYAKQRFAKVWVIPRKDLDFQDYTTVSDTAIIKKYLDKRGDNPKRGDIIHVKSRINMSDRDKYIYDGYKIEPLDRIGDYGEHNIIPFDFKVIFEFPIDYWHGEGSVSSGTGVYFNHQPFLDQLLENIKYEYDPKLNMYRLYTTFNYREKTYFIDYVYPDSLFQYMSADPEPVGIQEKYLPRIIETFEEDLNKQKLYFHPEAEDLYPNPSNDTLYLYPTRNLENIIGADERLG